MDVQSVWISNKRLSNIDANSMNTKNTAYSSNSINLFSCRTNLCFAIHSNFDFELITQILRCHIQCDCICTNIDHHHHHHYHRYLVLTFINNLGTATYLHIENREFKFRFMHSIFWIKVIILRYSWVVVCFVCVY